MNSVAERSGAVESADRSETDKDSTPPAERFWARVGQPGARGCREWLGARHERGYGVLRFGDRKRRAHQVAWELAHGVPVPEGKWILHRCDNPPCCEPDHLFAGTNTDNVHDAIGKGRMSGRKHSAEFIAQVKARLQGGARLDDVAREFGITSGLAHKLKVGRVRRDVAPATAPRQTGERPEARR